MYIKTLTIQGFKSYRDQVAVEPFSPGHNVIVGRNGSGKSNFFSAIRFVLSDAHTTMSREERQALLHDSSSSTSTTLSAFVEITFDNSDGRFPTGGEEVVLRRTIGLKKDEYSIDRRSASKADVANHLEAAGFSRSNPYYIVPQGRITHLTNIKDSERLNLLKEVAGTRVYEQRRQESLKVMEDANTRLAKIADTLKDIEKRLAELDEEKEELKVYYEKDKDRRCLEYAIYHEELNNVSDLLENLENRRKDEAETSGSRQAEFQERDKELIRLDQEISDLKQTQSQKRIEKESLIEERRNLARQLAQVEAQVKDDEESGERVQQTKQDLEERIAQVEVDLEEKQDELTSLLPQWETTNSELDSAKERLEEVRVRVTMLRSKGGRSAQFRTQAERDSALQSQVDELLAFEASQEQRRLAAVSSRNGIQAKLAKVQEDIQKREHTLQHHRQTKESSAREWNERKLRREELTEQKKELWKNESKLAMSTSYASQRLNDAQRVLASTMDKATSQGLQAIERIAQQNDIQGVHGPLYQLFTVDDKYQTAAEATANASLFHVVVDTDETASKVLEIMKREHTGRVTFMPLNRLKPKDMNAAVGSDAVALISRLQYDEVYAPAIRQVFGQMLVCTSLDVASAYVRSHGVDTITLEGNKVERRGALTGGYHDPRQSRLDAIRNVKRWKQEVDRDSEELSRLRQKAADIEQEIAGLSGDMQILEAKVKQASNSRGPLLDELSWLRSEENSVQEQLSEIQSQILAVERQVRQVRSERQSLEEEVQSPMAQGLSPPEQTELGNLNAEEKSLTSQLDDLSSRSAELTKTKNDLEIDLNELLRPERNRLTSQSEDVGEALNAAGTLTATDETAAKARREEFDRLRKQLDTLKKSIASAESDVDALAKKLTQMNEEHETLYAQQTETARAIEKQQKSVDRYMSKRQRLLESKDDWNGRIRDLGVLPEEAFEKYVNTDMDRLVRKLHKVHDALKDYSHVNKKAVEQYNSFTKDRDQFTQRYQEQKKGAQSIQSLIDGLDRQKDAAIEQTFKQVSKNFEEVFAKLVPAGRGRLIMQKRVDQNGARADESDEEMDGAATKSVIDSYTGISIKVSFNSKVDEGLRIQQLSGGQKSLVALATVFAIQKCDPAPFYLFDEIDANLDPQYRTAVAAMIHELATGSQDADEEDEDMDQSDPTRFNAQFITTTFRPEMVQVAQRHYGVLFDARKISNIRTISREEAATFVDAAADPGGR
ncbi:unnamed protein product [Sympodiomycopsis kandeliae]